MRTHEGGALDLVGRAVLQGLPAAAALGADQPVVEHGRHRHVRPSAEGNGLRGDGVSVAVGELLEIRTDHHVERIAAHLAVHPVLQRVPTAAARIESGGKLRGDVGIMENLRIGRLGAGALRRTEHVALVAAAPRGFALVLDRRGNVGIRPVALRAAGAAGVHAVARGGHPDGTMVLSAVGDGVVARRLAGRPLFPACAEVVGVVEVGVGTAHEVITGLLGIHHGQLEPAGLRPGLVALDQGLERTDGTVVIADVVAVLDGDVGAVVIGPAVAQTVEVCGEGAGCACAQHVAVGLEDVFVVPPRRVGGGSPLETDLPYRRGDPGIATGEGCTADRQRGCLVSNHIICSRLAPGGSASGSASFVGYGN